MHKATYHNKINPSQCISQDLTTEENANVTLKQYINRTFVSNTKLLELKYCDDSNIM
jgi:hypothetical protein